jgi:hypothetical protein
MKKSEQIIVLKTKLAEIKKQSKEFELESIEKNDEIIYLKSVIQKQLDKMKSLNDSLNKEKKETIIQKGIVKSLEYVNSQKQDQSELIERKNKTIIVRNRELEEVKQQRDHYQKILLEIANGNYEIKNDINILPIEWQTLVNLKA